MPPPPPPCADCPHLNDSGRRLSVRPKMEVSATRRMFWESMGRPPEPETGVAMPLAPLENRSSS